MVMDGNIYSSTLLPNNDNFIHLLRQIGKIWPIHSFKSTPHIFGEENIMLVSPVMCHIILLLGSLSIYINTWHLRYTTTCLFNVRITYNGLLLTIYYYLPTTKFSIAKLTLVLRWLELHPLLNIASVMGQHWAHIYLNV